MRKVKCCICGKELPEYDAKKLSLGASSKYMCFRCYETGNREADQSRERRIAMIRRRTNK